MRPLRLLVRLACGLAALAALPGCASQSQIASPQKPNIVVLIADDIGIADCGFSGSKDIPTPRLDRLAGEGITFRNGYVTPMCAPTRVAFLTGRNPAKIGFEDNRPGDSQHFGMDLSVPTVADLLRKAGYATGLVGKWHTGRGLNHEYSPWNRGYDEFFGYYGAFGTYLNPKLTRPPGKEEVVEGYSTDIFAKAACDFIQRHKAKPFFLTVAFNAAHLKQEAKPEDLARFQHIPDPKRRMAAAIISNLDSNVGRIADCLAKEGLDRNTLLVFFSDNGGESPILGTSNGPLRGMKFDVYEGGIRVPFFARWPEGLPKGKPSDALISVSDLLPTFAAAAQAKTPLETDGINLLPLLRDPKQEDKNRTLFWRTTLHSALQQQRKRPNAKVYIPHIAAARNANWKLVVLDHAGKQPQSELYDLATDPGEQKNLASAQPAVLGQLAQELDRWTATLKRQVIPPPPAKK